MEKNDGSYRRWYGEICGTMGKDRGEKERRKSSENLPRGPT